MSFTVLESTGALTVASDLGVDGTNTIEKFAVSKSGNLLKITREAGISPDAPVQVCLVEPVSAVDKVVRIFSSH